MQPTEENNNPGKKIIFIGIGLALLGLVVFGVIWAKNRADTYANNNATTEEIAQQEVEETPTEQIEQSAAAEGEGEVEGAEVNNQESASLPATGSNQTLLMAGVLSLVTFSLVKFAQSRVLSRRV